MPSHSKDMQCYMIAPICGLMVQDEFATNRDPHQSLSQIGHDRQILTPYPSLRKRKIAVKISLTGDAVYLPPRPEDLPDLIAALEIWTEDARSSELAVPVKRKRKKS